VHKRNRLFVSIALVYGLLGGLIAIVRLLGFILMTIYGIALHVLPRFGGFPLYSEQMADWQLYCANAGLPLMIAGWLGWRDMLVMAGGVLTYGAIVLFGLNMILTVRTKGRGRTIPVQ
jgi:hypothetical protein